MPRRSLFEAGVQVEGRVAIFGPKPTILAMQALFPTPRTPAAAQSYIATVSDHHDALSNSSAPVLFNETLHNFRNTQYFGNILSLIHISEPTRPY